MSEKPIPFKPLSTPINEYVITSGQYSGWHVHLTVFIGKMVIEAVNPDGTPKIKFNYIINSTAIPPVLEEEDHR